MGVLGLITEALGPALWRNTMAVLTHAHAARAAFGAQYDINSRQRRNILAQLLRQVGERNWESGDLGIWGSVEVRIIL